MDASDDLLTLLDIPRWQRIHLEIMRDRTGDTLVKVEILADRKKEPCWCSSFLLSAQGITKDKIADEISHICQTALKKSNGGRTPEARLRLQALLKDQKNTRWKSQWNQPT